MKRQAKCLSCGKTFWSPAKKSKFDGAVVTLENVCRTCLNRMRHAENVRNRGSVRAIPEGFEREIRIRELVNAEMARRRAESAKAMNVNVEGDKK